MNKKEKAAFIVEKLGELYLRLRVFGGVTTGVGMERTFCRTT